MFVSVRRVWLTTGQNHKKMFHIKLPFRNHSNNKKQAGERQQQQQVDVESEMAAQQHQADTVPLARLTTGDNVPLARFTTSDTRLTSDTVPFASYHVIDTDSEVGVSNESRQVYDSKLPLETLQSMTEDASTPHATGSRKQSMTGKT